MTINSPDKNMKRQSIDQLLRHSYHMNFDTLLAIARSKRTYWPIFKMIDEGQSKQICLSQKQIKALIQKEKGLINQEKQKQMLRALIYKFDKSEETFSASEHSIKQLPLLEQLIKALKNKVIKLCFRNIITIISYFDFDQYFEVISIDNIYFIRLCEYIFLGNINLQESQWANFLNLLSILNFEENKKQPIKVNFSLLEIAKRGFENYWKSMKETKELKQNQYVLIYLNFPTKGNTMRMQKIRSQNIIYDDNKQILMKVSSFKQPKQKQSEIEAIVKQLVENSEKQYYFIQINQNIQLSLHLKIMNLNFMRKEEIQNQQTQLVRKRLTELILPFSESIKFTIKKTKVHQNSDVIVRTWFTVQGTFRQLLKLLQNSLQERFLKYFYFQIKATNEQLSLNSRRQLILINGLDLNIKTIKQQVEIKQNADQNDISVKQARYRLATKNDTINRTEYINEQQLLYKNKNLTNKINLVTIEDLLMVWTNNIPLFQAISQNLKMYYPEFGQSLSKLIILFYYKSIQKDKSKLQHLISPQIMNIMTKLFSQIIKYQQFGHSTQKQRPNVKQKQGLNIKQKEVYLQKIIQKFIKKKCSKTQANTKKQGPLSIKTNQNGKQSEDKSEQQKFKESIRQFLQLSDDPFIDKLYNYYLQDLNLRKLKESSIMVRINGILTKQLKKFITEFVQFQIGVSLWQDIMTSLKLVNQDQNKFNFNLIYQFKPVQIKCLGCATFFYAGINIRDDSINRTPVKTFPLVDKMKENECQIKSQICSMLNSGGGVILFDCVNDYKFVVPRGQYLTEKNKEQYEQRVYSYLNCFYPKPQIKVNVFVTFVPIIQLSNKKIQNNLEHKDSYKLYGGHQATEKQGQFEIIPNFTPGLYVTRVTICPTDSSRLYIWMEQEQQNLAAKVKLASFYHSQGSTIELVSRQFIRVAKFNFKQYYIPQDKLQEQQMLPITQNYFQHKTCKAPQIGCPVQNRGGQKNIIDQNLQKKYKFMTLIIIRKQNIQRMKVVFKNKGVNCQVKLKFQQQNYKLKPAMNTAVLYHDIKFDQLVRMVNYGYDFQFDGKTLITINITEYLKIQINSEKDNLKKQDFQALKGWLQKQFPSQNLRYWKYTENKAQYYLQTDSRTSTLLLYFILKNNNKKVFFKNPLYLDKKTKNQKAKIWKQIIFEPKEVFTEQNYQYFYKKIQDYFLKNQLQQLIKQFKISLQNEYEGYYSQDRRIFCKAIKGSNLNNQDLKTISVKYKKRLLAPKPSPSNTQSAQINFQQKGVDSNQDACIYKNIKNSQAIKQFRYKEKLLVFKNQQRDNQNSCQRDIEQEYSEYSQQCQLQYTIDMLKDSII